MYHEEMEEIVQLTGSPDRAYGIFVDVVKHVFDWDESSGRGSVYSIVGWGGYC